MGVIVVIFIVSYGYKCASSHPSSVEKVGNRELWSHNMFPLFIVDLVRILNTGHHVVVTSYAAVIDGFV